jgi:hypothetical protein
MVFLSIVFFALLIAPIDRPNVYIFLFFIVAVDQLSVVYVSPKGRVLSADISPNTSLSVGGIFEIGNCHGSSFLALFARTVSFTLSGHSVDHDVCSSLWQAAYRLRGAGDMPAHSCVLWLPPQWPHFSVFEYIKLICLYLWHLKHWVIRQLAS